MNLNRLNVLFQEAGDNAGGGTGGEGGAGAGAAAKKPDQGTGDGTGSAAAKGGDGDKGGQDKGGTKTYAWTDGWREQLAAGDEKAATRLQRFDSPEAIWRSYRAMEQRMSSGELKSVLPKDAKPEEVAKWRQENGIPETHDKYDLKFDDGLVIGEDDKPIIDTFLKVAHEKNYNNDQVKDAIKWYYGEVERQTQERETADQEASKQSQDVLRGKWGNDYRPNMNRVHALLDTAPAGLKDAFLQGRMADGTPIGSSAPMLEYLAFLSRQLNPVGTVVPGAGANIGSAIADEIAKIEKVMKDDRKAYNKDEPMQARYRELLSAKERMGEQGKQAKAMAG